MLINPVVKKVNDALKKYISRESRWLLAVSGGADSIALADAAAELVQEGLLKACVMHIEHGLRGEEAMLDARFTEEFCRSKGLPFVCRHIDVKKYACENACSVEKAARDLRYAALNEEAAKIPADYIVTAHHSDDQAETVLLKLLRGTSAAGLSGMQVQNGNILRPLLCLSRADLEAYCAARNITYCRDSTNDDTIYTRNRVRNELLPYLEKNFNPSVKKALVQTADVLREDEAFFDELVRAELEKRATVFDNEFILDVAAWNKIGVPVRKRILRQCYFIFGGSELSYSQTNALDMLCLQGRSGKRINLPEDINAVYGYEKLSFTKDNADKEQVTSFCENFTLTDSEQLIKVLNGIVTVKIKRDFSWAQIRSLIMSDSEQAIENRFNIIVYPLELLENDKLTLRSRMNGDRFTPYGLDGSKKLKDYFIDKKIPREQRDEKVLLCCGDKILGIFGVANSAWKQGCYSSWLVAEFKSKEL